MFDFLKSKTTEVTDFELFFMVTGQYWAFYRHFGTDATYDPGEATKFFTESLKIEKKTVSPLRARQVVEFFTLNALNSGEFPEKLRRFKEMDADPESDSWKLAMLEVSDELAKKGLSLF
jgi:hypothetical protein